MESNKVVTGVVGLGAMGLQMARHVAEKGMAVVGYDISDVAMRQAEAHGVGLRSSAAAVCADADVVVIMVQTDAQVTDILVGGGEALAQLRPGSVICIASSVAPETCQELAALAAERGIGVLDTPVVLGQEAANEGRLTTFVGGDEQWLPKARPILACFAREIIHVGPSGHGQLTKTINNMLLWACMSANYEVLSLAKAFGCDLPRIIAALGHSSGANWSLSRWGRSTGKWAEKDMDVALELAQQAKVPVPLAGLVDQLMKGMNQDRMKALLG